MINLEVLCRLLLTTPKRGSHRKVEAQKKRSSSWFDHEIPWVLGLRAGLKPFVGIGGRMRKVSWWPINECPMQMQVWMICVSVDPASMYVIWWPRCWQIDCEDTAFAVLIVFRWTYYRISTVFWWWYCKNASCKGVKAPSIYNLLRFVHPRLQEVISV